MTGKERKLQKSILVEMQNEEILYNVAQKKV